MDHLRHFDLDADEVAHFMGAARKHKALVLDLRDNSGGYTDTLKEILGYLFDKDIKIADRIGRKETEPMIAKHQGNPFTGKLIVLVDSGSASLPGPPNWRASKSIRLRRERCFRSNGGRSKAEPRT